MKTSFIDAKVTRSGDRLALSGSDKSIKIISLTTGSEVSAFQNGNLKSFSIAFTPDGRDLLVSSPDGSITVRDAARTSAVRTFTHESGVRCIDIDPTGKVISGGFDKTVKMWNYQTGVMMGKFPALTTEISSLAISPDGQMVVAGTTNGSLTIFNANTFVAYKSITDKRAYATSIIFSPDGKYFAAPRTDSTVTIYNGKTATELISLKNSAGQVTSAGFHPMHNYLITASSTVAFWDVTSGKSFFTIPNLSLTPALVAVTSNSILAVIGKNGELQTFQMFDKKPDQNPPVITIHQPKSAGTDPIKMFSSEVEIYGTVSDESAIKEVRINNELVSTTPATPDERESIHKDHSAVSFLTPVPLTNTGNNIITISATDVEQNNGSKEITIAKLPKESAVEMVFPTEANFDTDQISVDLQFKVWFDFTSYTVQLNTIEIIKKENVPKKPSGTLRTEKLSLSAGLNQIQLAVNGRGGERIRKTINITRRTLGAPVTTAENTPLRNTTGQPQRWAVIVGVSEYGNPAIKNLAYADRDARAFAEFLKSPSGGGFEEDRVKMLLNKDATLQNVKTALFNFLRQTVDKDLVIIYFAGHGAPEPANPNNNYLLCYDTDPNSLETTAFPMWDVNTALQRYIPSKRVVVFTDACHSGGISSDIATRGMSTTEDNMINQYLADLSKTKEGIIVFTASQAGEVSQELEKLGHGVFTYFLLQGMKGEADFNNDYTVTIGELMDFVEEKVKRQTSGNQHPTRNQGTYDKDLTISMIPN